MMLAIPSKKKIAILNLIAHKVNTNASIMQFGTLFLKGYKHKLSNKLNCKAIV